jgi:hypothetical protein
MDFSLFEFSMVKNTFDGIGTLSSIEKGSKN